MKKQSVIRRGLVYLLCVVALVNVVYYSDLIGHVAYAFERGKLKADVEHLAAVSGTDVAGIEELSHAFQIIAETTKPAVVHIRAVSVSANRDLLDKLPKALREQLRRERRTGTGSGVIVDTEGHIVTNNHVVSGAQAIFVTLMDGRHFEAEVVGTDSKTDLAVIKIDADRLHPARFGDSDRMKVGYMVLAIGSPFRLDHTVSHGIISALQRHDVIRDIEYEGFLQTDAPINPGNSGGPLINTRGEVIGINTAIATESGGHQGVGFAIPSNTVTSVLDALKAGRKVVRGFLGVSIWSVNPELAESYGLDRPTGALVRGLLEGGPAEKSGLRQGDIILGLNARPVESNEDLQLKIAGVRPGAEVDLTVWRERQEKHIKVMIEAQPTGFSTRASADDIERFRKGPEDADPDDDIESDSSPADDETFDRLGLEIETVSPRLARRFQIDESIQTGAIVTKVDPTSSAYDKDLHRGCVITRANGKRITNVAQLKQAFTRSALRKGVRLWVKPPRGDGFPVVLRLK